jgi:hypothetical protein
MMGAFTAFEEKETGQKSQQQEILHKVRGKKHDLYMPWYLEDSSFPHGIATLTFDCYLS